MGILIDVDTKSDGAKKDLSDINRSLASIINSSSKVKTSLSNATNADFKKINAPVLETIKSFNILSRTAPPVLDNIAKSSDRAASSMGGLKTAAIGIAASFLALKGISVFYRMADDLTNVQNRLSLVVKNSDELLRKQKELLTLAADTRSSFASTADVYVDFSKSLETIGISGSRVTNVIRTIQQAAALSGSGPDALRGALTQLNQGIASGTLRGEELNSVLEQMKYLGFGVSKALNLNTGELRKFAEDGKLTTKVLLETIESLAAETDKDFKKTSVTISQASEQLRQAVGYFFGDLNKYYGFSDRFGKLLLRMASSLREGNTVFIAELFSFRQKIANFINGFDTANEAEVLVKAVFRFDISPLEVIDKYQQYEQIRKRVTALKKFFAKPVELDVPAGTENAAPETNVEKVKSGISEGSALFQAFVNSAKISVTNLANLLPSIALPVVGLLSGVTASIKTLYVESEADTYKTINPIARQLEGLAEFTTGYFINDNILERSWVRLFRSDNIVEFRKNLELVNEARDTRKWNDFSFLVAEAGTGFRRMAKPIEDVLISVGLLNNRIIQVRSIRLDRIIKYFEIFGSVAKRIYQDIFASTVEPLVAGVRNRIVAYGETLIEAFGDVFSSKSGASLATKFVLGIRRSFQFLLIDIPKAFEQFGADAAFSRLGESLKGGLVTIGAGLFEFLKGFFGQLGRSISDLISVDTFSKFANVTLKGLQYIFEGIKKGFQVAASSVKEFVSNVSLSINLDTSSLDSAKDFIGRMFEEIYEKTRVGLSQTQRYIEKFGKNVKAIFFDIYDAVVGNSYWPDMVDGVVSYTDRLSVVYAYMDRFKAFMLDVFDSIAKSAVGMGSGLGDALSEFFTRLKAANFSQVLGVISSNAAAGLIAGLLLVFGDFRLKLAGINYFLSIFDGAVNNAFSAFGPLLLQAVASASGAFAEKMIEGLINSFGLLVQAAPIFLGSLVKSLSPLGDTLTGIIGSLPLVAEILSNKILYAVGVAAALYATLVDGGGAKVKEAVLGKTNKKGEKTDGLIDYITPIFSKGSNEKGIAESLFGGRKMALAIAAVFGSALLDSVSIIESLFVGVPLLGFAFLGKDGGVQLTKQFLFFSESLIAGIYNAGLDKVGAVAGKSSLIYKLFEIPKNVYELIFGGSKGPIGEAFGNVLGEFKKGITNLRQNAADYAAGGISLTEAFFTTKTTGKGAIPIVEKETLKIKERFTDLFSTIGAIQFNGRPISQYFSQASSFVKAKSNELKAAYKITDFTDTIGVASSSLFSRLSGMVSKSVLIMNDGLGVLLGLLKNKFVIFGVLTAGLASTAFAAADTSGALDQLSDSISLLVVGLGSLAAILFTLGKAKTLSTTYTQASTAFKQAAKNTQEYKDTISSFDADKSRIKSAFDSVFKIEQEARKKNFKAALKDNLENLNTVNKARLDAITDPKLRSATETAQKLSTAAYLKNELINFNRNEEKLRTVGSKAATSSVDKREAAALKGFEAGSGAAGLSAIKDDVLKSFSKLKDNAVSAGKSLFEFAKNPKILVTSLQTTFASFTNLQGAMAATSLTMTSLGAAAKGLSTAFGLLKVGELAASFIILRAATASAFTGLVTGPLALLASGLGSLKTLGPKVFDALRGSASKVGPAIKDALLGTADKKGLLSLLGKFIIKPAGLLGIGATVAGAAGLWLFGPGNTFFDKLEYAYDQVKSFFGIRATSETGRREELKKNLETREIDGLKSNFSADIARIDFEKLTPIQFEALSSAATKAKESLDQLAISSEQQNGLTPDQRNDFERINKEISQILLRAPNKPAETFDFKFDKTIQDILAVDNTLYGMFKRFLGFSPTLTRIGEGLDAFAQSIADIFFSEGNLIFAGIASALASFTPAGPLGGLVVGAFALLVGGIIQLVFKGLAYLGDKLLEAVGLKGAFDEIGAGIVSIYDALTTGIVDGAKELAKNAYLYLYEKLGQAPSQNQLKEASRLQAESADYRQFSKELPADVQESINKQLESYNVALNDLNRLSKGDNGITFKNNEEYLKALNAAADAFAKARRELSISFEIFGKEGKTLFEARVFNEEMKILSDETKSLLGLDLGKFGEDFLGTADQLDVFRELNTKVESYNNLIKKSGDQNTRLSFILLKNRAIEQAKDFNAATKEKSNFANEIAYNVKITGVDTSVAELAQLKLFNTETYKSFVQTANELAKVQFDYAQALESDDPKRIAELIVQLAKLRAEASAKLPGTIFLDDLNAKLQKVNISAINDQSYLSLSAGQADSLSKALKSVQNAKNSLDNSKINGLNISGGNLEEYQKKLKDYLAEIDKLKLATQSTIVLQVKTVIEGSNSPAAAALAIADLTATPVPIEIGMSTSKTAAYNKLIAKQLSLRQDIATIESNQRAGVITFGGVDKEYAAKQASLYQVEKQLERLKEISILTLDGVISKASETGFEVNTAVFKSFSKETQSLLIANAGRLEALSKTLEASSAKSLGTAGIAKVLGNQEELLKSSGEAIAKELENTAGGYDQIFSRLGINTEDFSNVTEESLKRLLSSFAEIFALTNNVKQAKGPEAFLKATLALAKARKQVNDTFEASTASFEARSSKINELLGANLTTEDFATSASGLYNALYDTAQKFSIDLKDVLSKGFTAAGESAASFFKRAADFKTVGAFVSLFKSIGQSLNDALYEGAENGFKRISEAAPTLGLAFEDFVKLDGGTRKQLGRQAVVQDSLKKAAEIPKITPELAEILNSLDANNSEAVLAKFEGAFFSTFGKTFEDATAAPLDANTKATEANTAALLGKGFVGPMAPPVEVPKLGGGIVNSSFYSALNNSAEKNISAEAQGQLGRRGLSAKFSNFGVDRTTTELASSTQLSGIEAYVKTLEDNKKKLETASDTERASILAANEVAKKGLEELATSIRTGATAVSDAGKAFSERSKGDFQSAFSGLLKGENEGGGVFKTFARNLSSSFADNVIDTFSKGVTDKLFETLGLRDLASKYIGENQAALGSIVGESLSGAFGKVKEFFSTGLSDIDIGSVFDNFKTILSDGFNSLTEIDFGSIFSQLGSFLSEGLSSIMGSLGGSGGGFGGIASLFSFFADGGKIAGPGTGRSDSIPAMVSNGEFIVNARSTKQYEPLLRAINQNRLPKFADGGFVGSEVMQIPTFRQIKPDQMPSGGNSQVINLSITGDISRQTKKEIYGMLPEIASGVNSHNREKGYRG